MIEYSNSEMAEAINECIHNALYRDVLRLRLLDGMTYEKIAERVDRTPRQIATIMSRNTPILYRWLCRKTS